MTDMSMSLVANARSYDWPTWGMGILRSFISGGSAAMVGGMASMGIAPDKFNLSSSVGNTIKLMAIMFLFQGFYRMFEFLALHAAPDKLQQALETAQAANKDVGAAIREAQGAVNKP